MANNIFGEVPINKKNRSFFDLTHERKFSMEMGKLYPIMCVEAHPGDTFKNKTEFMLRFQPLVAPIMHQIDANIEFYKVPLRLLWKDFEDFYTGSHNGKLIAPEELPVMPKFPLNILSVYSDNGTGTLCDYLGYPTGFVSDDWPDSVSASSLPLRAYNLIYNTFYKDENLIDDVDIYYDNQGLQSSTEIEAMNVIRKRAWKKDYFTSALPFAQKGTPVTIPLQGNAPVELNTSSANAAKIKTVAMPIVAGAELEALTGGMSSDLTMQGGGVTGRIQIDPNNTLFANLQQVTASTINDLRAAIQVQIFKERDARSGTRFKEFIESHFGGVKVQDYRIQRPEFLGGGKVPVVISEVLQNSETASSPQGNMAGHGISFGNNAFFKATFEEPCYVIGIMSVMPKATYQQGLSRMFTRYEKLDFPFPEFAHLGEQAVKNSEIYMASNSALHDNEFGYQSRYAELKYMPSTVHGLMKTDYAYWHLGRIFSNQPNLNEEFINCTPRTDIFAVPDGGQNLIVELVNNLDTFRCLPVYGEPGYIDHP